MKSNTPPALTVMFPVNFLSPVHEAAEGHETLPLVPSPTVRFPVCVNAKAPRRNVELSRTRVVPAKVIVPAPRVVVPESTSTIPNVYAPLRATVPLKFVVDAALMVTVRHPEPIVPVKLRVPPLATVNVSADPVQVRPADIVRTPVVTEIFDMRVDALPEASVTNPPILRFPVAAASSLVTDAVGALIVTAPVTVSVTPPATVTDVADAPPVKVIEATVTLVLADIATAAFAIVTVSVFPL